MNYIKESLTRIGERNASSLLSLSSFRSGHITQTICLIQKISLRRLDVALEG